MRNKNGPLRWSTLKKSPMFPTAIAAGVVLLVAAIAMISSDRPAMATTGRRGRATR